MPSISRPLAALLTAAAALVAAPPGLAQEEDWELRVYELPDVGGAAHEWGEHVGVGSSLDVRVALGGGLSFDDDRGDGTWDALDTLVEYAEGEIERLTGGRYPVVEARGDRLAVAQRPEVHTHLEAVLDDLTARAARTAAVEVEFRAVDADAAQAVLAAGAGAPLEADVEALLAAGRRLARLRLRARDGQRVTDAAVTRSAFLGDLEVNQTGVLPVLNPVNQELVEGAMVEVTVSFPHRAGDPLQIDCRAELARRGGEPRRRTFAGTELELPVVDLARLGSTLRLEPGTAAVVGAAPDPATVGGYVAVVCRLLEVDPPPAGPGPARLPLRRYVVAGLCEVPDYVLPAPAFPNDYCRHGGGGRLAFGDEATGGGLDADTLTRWVFARVAPETWEDAATGAWVRAADGPSLIVVAKEAVQAQVGAFLADLRASRRPLRYEVAVLRLDSDSVLPASLDDAAWSAVLEQGELEARGVLTGLSGQLVALDVRRDRRALVDIEQSAGGAEAETARVRDPIIDVIWEGARLALTGWRQDDRVALAAEVELRGPAELTTAESEWGVIEHYRAVRHLNVDARTSFPVGKGVVLSDQDAGDGRRLVLVRAR